MSSLAPDSTSLMNTQAIMLPITKDLEANSSGQRSMSKLPSITQGGKNADSAKILEILPDLNKDFENLH